MRRSSPTRRLSFVTFAAVSLVTLAFIALPTAVLAQSAAGHVYELTWYRAHPGVEAEYSEIYEEYVRPTLDEMARRGDIVTYLDLVTTAGDTGEATHVLLVEYPDWGALDGLEAKQDAAAEEVHGRPYSEIWEESVAPLRLQVRRQLYTATVQQ